MFRNREFPSKLNWALDNIVPSIIRDNRFIMKILMLLVYKKNAHLILDFKKKVSYLTKKEYSDYYKIFDNAPIRRATDLNKQSIIKILSLLKGKNILDVGCGRGYLVNEINKNFSKVNITGIDININKSLKNTKNIKYIEGDVNNIDFPDNKFDTVICTHVLEHVLDSQKAISELRRVTKKRLIIVVPRQRSHKYTFDLHVSFFYYHYDIQKLMSTKSNNIFLLGNDYLYFEDKI